jgi:hypothetical protein
MHQKTIYQFQSYTNKANKPIKYILYYINCFDIRQQKTDILESGQTLQLFNSGSKAVIFEPIKP